MPGGRQNPLKQMELPVHPSSCVHASPSGTGWPEVSSGVALKRAPQMHMTSTNRTTAQLAASAASVSRHSSCPGKHAFSKPVRRSSRHRCAQPDCTVS